MRYILGRVALRTESGLALARRSEAILFTGREFIALWSRPHLQGPAPLDYTTATLGLGSCTGPIRRCFDLPFHARTLPTLAVSLPDATFQPSQAAEWGRARVVLVCEPGTETLFDLLLPSAANFIRPFSLAQAQAEHRAFRRRLEEHDVRVIDLRQALLNGVDMNDNARARLESWAGQSVRLDAADLAADDAALAAADLAASLASLDPAALVDLVMLAPTIKLTPNPQALDPTSRFLARYELAGGSAYYLRDPLFTTRSGVVIGRLRLEKRRRENDLAAFALEQLGVTPLYCVQPPGFLEGGDFIPAGDFVLQGQGLLSDEDGIGQCLQERVYGHVEVAVVRDPRRQMDEMHLDTYFAFLAPDLCLLCETRLHGADEPEVDLYRPDGDPDHFRYRLVSCLPFSRYLTDKGIRILTFSTEESRNFAPNGLLLAPNHWLGVRQAGPALFDRLHRHGVNASPIDFSALTGGYGGPHCSTQVVVRE